MNSLQLDMICTYKLMTEDEEEEEIGIKQMLYQFQLLQAFNMSDYNDNELNDKIQALYQQLKNVEFIKILIQKNQNTTYFKEEELIFRTLFSYDYFDLFHKCLYYHSKNESIDNAMGLLLEEFNRN